MTNGIFRRLRGKRGFTLVEMICAIAILTVLMAAMVIMYVPLNKISASLKGDAKAQSLAQFVEEYMSKCVQTTTGFELYEVNGSWSGLDAHINAFRTTAGYNHPHALIVRYDDNGTSDVNDDMTYFYDISLNPAVAVTSADLPGGANIENYRVFNRSFYEGIYLETSIYVDPINPTDQEGRQTNLYIKINAWRRQPDSAGTLDLSIGATRESLTTMVNIGRRATSNPSDTSRIAGSSFTYTAPTKTPITAIPAVSHTGDYLILYNNEATPRL